jgi:hypothetical protein
MSKRTWFGVLSVGLLSTVIGCAEMHHKEKEEGDEVKMKFSEVPAAVQKTLTDAAMGAKIDTVDKETDKGAVVYEADAKIDGKNYEIKVSPDGKLISKNIDKEEGEKDEKEKK